MVSFTFKAFWLVASLLALTVTASTNAPVSANNIHIGDKEWEWWFAEKVPHGSKRPAAPIQNWPTIRDCKKPDNDQGFKNKWGVQMPVYFTVRQCDNRSGRGNGAKELRVTYGLFYEKDGFNSNGHPYDWENVVITWRQFGDSYYKDEIWLSAHKGGRRITGWENIPQTVDSANWFEANGKSHDHPKVYVGWCKHAMFFDKGGLKDVLSCLTDNEYRTDDWYYVARTKSDLLNASPGTDHWTKFENENWGDAWSKPSNEYWAACDRA
ncbi:hypothetical protein COL940_007957 [Colletotrichum noveboracense]|nr:hypothetical protein COL940_007957 [Colletotrichum noveboracense]